MAQRAHRRGLAHYAAPVAFLAAVTIAVLLVRSGLGGGAAAPATTTGATVTHTSTVATRTHRKPHKKKRHVTARYYVVQSGDTYGTSASRGGPGVARLEA